MGDINEKRQRKKNVDLVKVIGNQIAFLRLAKGWSQADLAERCCWDRLSGQGRISHYEKCRRLPDPTELRMFAKVFGVPIAALYGEETDTGTAIVPLLSMRDVMDLHRRRSAIMKKAKAQTHVPPGVAVGKNAFAYQMENQIYFVDPDKEASKGSFVMASTDSRTVHLYEVVNVDGKQYLMREGNLVSSAKAKVYGTVAANLTLYH